MLVRAAVLVSRDCQFIKCYMTLLLHCSHGFGKTGKASLLIFQIPITFFPIAFLYFFYFLIGKMEWQSRCVSESSIASEDDTWYLIMDCVLCWHLENHLLLHYRTGAWFRTQSDARQPGAIPAVPHRSCIISSQSLNIF